MESVKEKIKISRRDFLRLLGVGALFLGSGMLGRGFEVLKKLDRQYLESASSTKIIGQPHITIPFDYIIYDIPRVSNHRYRVQRTSDGQHLIKTGSPVADVAIQAAIDQ